MTRHQYDNAYSPHNVYGHTVELLRKVSSGFAHGHQLGGVHLDIGCGFGAIAEPVRDELGLTYVGIDGAAVGLESLKSRGFETHQLLLAEPEETLRCIRDAIGGRTVRSISMLDTLEHLYPSEAILYCLRELCAKFDVPVVLSVPNIAHRDVALKLAIGHWDYTLSGLLDHTHVRFFTSESFEQTLLEHGLHVLDAYDVLQNESDQFFPRTLPSLCQESNLGTFLRSVRHQADSHAVTNQFVRACVAGERGPSALRTRDEVDRPFLSIVTRTQGKRLKALEELLLCLAGQSDDDFEHVIVGHNLSSTNQSEIRQLIESMPEWLSNKIRLVLVVGGSRTRPLNAGFQAARGSYISIMDDDDLPFCHWVETFRKLAPASAGRILRASCVLQRVEQIVLNGSVAVRNTGPMESRYPSSFDHLAHLSDNYTPNMCLAFPRGIFHSLNIRFDESITTAEDWDFLIRSANMVGVSSGNEITSIYRWWERAESSRTVHDQAEWVKNHEAILRKLDSTPFLLSAGETKRIRQLMRCAAEPEKLLARLERFEQFQTRYRRILTPVQRVRTLLRELRGARPTEYFCIAMSFLSRTKAYLRRCFPKEQAVSKPGRRRWMDRIAVAKRGSEPVSK